MSKATQEPVQSTGASDDTIEKIDTADTAQVPAVPVKRQKPALPPRAPNPDRKKRNNNPGKLEVPAEDDNGSPVLTQKKKTSVSVSTTHKALLALKLAELEAEKVRMLAEMELEDKAEEADKEEVSVNTIADIQMMPFNEFAALGGALGDPMDSDADEFPIDLSHAAFDDLDNDHDTVIARQKKEAEAALHKKLIRGGGKKRKGETRAAVEEEKEKVCEARKRKSEGSEENENPKKLKPLHPQGLVPGWQERLASAVDGKGSKTKTKKTIIPATPLGGLSDFDAHTAPSKVKVVEIATDSDSDEDAPAPVKPKRSSKALPKTVSLLPVKQEPIRHIDFSKPGKPMVLNLRTTSSSSLAAPMSTPTPVTQSAAAGGGGGGGSQIPAYAQARWATEFLPTVGADLGTLPNQWDLPGGDVAFLQRNYYRVYSNSQYRGKDRIYDKRAWPGRRANTMVDVYFSTAEYIGHPKKIARYAKYALRHDGPSVWEVPAPMGVKKGDVNYIAPDGVFTSVFIINTFGPWIKSISGSVYNTGYQRGALAMVLTVLERVWMRYTTSYKVDDGSKFSCELVGTLVDDYYRSVEKLSERWWGLIMAKVRAKNLEDVAVPLSASTMEANRHSLFTPSRPAGSGDESDLSVWPVETKVRVVKHNLPRGPSAIAMSNGAVVVRLPKQIVRAGGSNCANPDLPEAYVLSSSFVEFKDGLVNNGRQAILDSAAMQAANRALGLTNVKNHAFSVHHAKVDIITSWWHQADENDPKTIQYCYKRRNDHFVLNKPIGCSKSLPHPGKPSAISEHDGTNDGEEAPSSAQGNISDVQDAEDGIRLGEDAFTFQEMSVEDFCRDDESEEEDGGVSNEDAVPEDIERKICEVERKICPWQKDVRPPPIPINLPIPLWKPRWSHSVCNARPLGLRVLRESRFMKFEHRNAADAVWNTTPVDAKVA
ncbi:hypothetical protein C8R43DRAFT_951454 [Mycena crocata]|nr:hypothetical protein C8R43DRAFT_951454 [Mycena crocata]